MILRSHQLRTNADVIGRLQTGRVIAAWAAGGALLVLCCGLAAGQGRDAGMARSTTGPSRLELMVRAANAWDLNHDQVYTCDEWKKFVTDIFNKADRNHDGFVDAQEFKAIRAAAEQFRDASLGYFDDNGDGRMSRSEFVDKPNPFFLQLDLNRDCKVTLDEIMATAARQTPRGASGRPSGSMR